MKFVIGFFRFWYDFIVGDDWRIALMVVVALGAGIVLLRWDIVPTEWIPIICTALITAGLLTSLARERRKVRSG